MEAVLPFVLTVHNYLRFVILALGLLGVLRSLVSLGTREARYMRVDEVLGRGYSGALDVQALAGVVLIIGVLGQPEAAPIQVWIHPAIMLPAVALSHLGRRFEGRSDRDRHKGQLAIYAGSLALIAVGLAVIGQLRLI